LGERKGVFNMRLESRLTPFLHAYKVKGLHQFLSDYKHIIIEIAHMDRDHGEDGVYNVPICIEADKADWTTELHEIHERLVDKFYIWEKSEYIPPSDFGAYVQEEGKCSNVWHNHIEDNSSIVTVCYIDPPKEGGEISFMFKGEVESFAPQEDMIYIFPSWALHRPEPHKGKTRVSINWGKYSQSKVINKVTGDIW